MRNLRKVIALLVAITVLAVTVVPVFADESESEFLFADKAKILGDLDLIDGSGTDADGNKVFQLGEELDRQTAVTLIIKIFGKKEAALALTAEEIKSALSKFEDKGDIHESMEAYVAYAVIEGLSNGTSTKTFSPELQLDGRTLATLVLRELGYEVSAEGWKNAAVTLAEVGGLNADLAEAYNEMKLNQDKMYGVA